MEALESPRDLALLLAHLAATIAMAGIAWFVQVVHYPLFGLVGSEAFGRFHEGHLRRTGWVVTGPMLVEAGTALALVAARPAGVPALLAWAGLALLAVVWASTVWLQVPAHDRLGRGWDPRAHARLVRTSWIRTAAWTARAALALAMLAARTA